MPHLYYVHDPMCSWCWAFRPVLTALLSRLPSGISCSRLLGGLAPDSDLPMPESMRETLQSTWRHIQTKIPETRFNFDFWRRQTARRSTYPACRAVIATRNLDASREDEMILAIQQAYYLQARNPSDNTTLIDLAAAIGLDRQQFSDSLDNPRTQAELDAEVEQARELGAYSFPSLILRQGQNRWPIPVDYHAADAMLKSIRLILD